MKRVFLSLLFTVAMASIAIGSQNVYVQSKSAKIMSNPSFKSEIVGKAERGDALKITETGKGWYKVEHGSISGWVNRLNVSKKPPMNKVSVIDKAGESIELKARRRSSAVTSAAAARGLSEQERKRKSSDDEADFTNLRKLENLTRQIPEEDVEKFNKPAE
jgi:hypothetical protein